MSKGPTPRHSKSPEPVTIDLDATDVTPKNEDLRPKPSAAGQAGAKAGGRPTSARSTPSSAKADALKTDGGKTDAGKAGDAKPGMEKPGAKPAQSSVDAKAPDAHAGKARPGSTEDKASASTGKSGGGLGMVASGLIGAVIALGGGYALQMGGLLPAPNGSGDQVQAVSAKLDSVSTNVETLASQVAESASANGAGIAAEVSARLDALETGLAQVAAGGETSDPDAMASLNEKIAGLEARLAALGESSGNGATDPALSADISEMRAAQTGLQSAVTELQSQTSASISELSEKIAGIEQRQSDLASRLDEPGRQVDLARAIAAAGLKSAIDRGGPFMSELEAFASVAPDDPAVSELRDLAARGVPSRSRLIEGFPDAATTAIAAAEPAEPDAGLVNRLMSSALSVVKVRKVGEIEGDSPEAITARAEARLMDGNLDAALAEWNSLPEASRAAASAYGDALAARARAEKLIAASLAPAGTPASSEAPAN
tara:strand:- start:485 stop:1945 length:1461 start_codon:yes stop_codon:yes gene_type:complete